jgi:hypothetical protein
VVSVTGYTVISLGSHVYAFVQGCTCHAATAWDCDCPDAVWFERVDRDEYEDDEVEE